MQRKVIDAEMLTSVVNRANDLRSDDIPPVRKLIGDSRAFNHESPFELRIGYSFSVVAMELCVKSMKIGEKSRFLCVNEYLFNKLFKLDMQQDTRSWRCP